MKYFPDKLPKGRLPSRDYFFNVMHTLEPQYVQGIIKHAMEQRHSANALDKQTESIVCSKEMWDKLNELPHVSCKLLPIIILVQHAKGRRYFCSRREPSQSPTIASGGKYLCWACLSSNQPSHSSSKLPLRTRR